MTRQRESEPPGERHQELEIVWSRKALARLAEIRQFVALDKPGAAARLAARMVSVVATLRTHPNMGRAGVEPSTRHSLHRDLPYRSQADHNFDGVARSAEEN